MSALNLSSDIELLHPECEEVRLASAMLRKQAEAIKVLREAIEASMSSSQWPHTPFMVRGRIEQALKDTEEFK